MFGMFLRDIPARFIDVYRGYRLLWHVAAAAITAVLVFSGFDWWFYTLTRSPDWTSVIYAAGVSGFYVPILVPIALYIYARLTSNTKILLYAIAIAEAVLIAWFVTTFYKVFTGRIAPEFLVFTQTPDISHQFQFGFWRNGIFWGWPSSHAGVAWAMAAVITRLSGKSVSAIALFYAAFIAVGAAVGFHWFSDVIAGVILGGLVGAVVGDAFKQRLK